MTYIPDTIDTLDFSDAARDLFERDTELTNLLNNYSLDDIEFYLYNRDPDGETPRELTTDTGETWFTYTDAGMWIRFGHALEYPIITTETDTPATYSGNPSFTDTHTSKPSERFWLELYDAARRIHDPTIELTEFPRPPEQLNAHERYPYHNLLFQLFGPSKTSREALYALAKAKQITTGCDAEDARDLSFQPASN